jgi:hypothetical protein
LEIHSPNEVHVFYLGPHAPQLTEKEIDLLHRLWLDLSNEVSPEELHHRDVVHFALDELERETKNHNRGEMIDRLRQHLQQIKCRRLPHV